MNRKTSTIIKALFVYTLAIFIISCSTSRTTRRPVPSGRSVGYLPPGQAKKVYGHQSAKAFAPGQQKKNEANKGVSNKSKNKGGK